MGISIDHGKKRQRITISMPYYIQNVIKRFGLPDMDRRSGPDNAPAAIPEVQHGCKGEPQPAQILDESDRLDEGEVKRIQQIIGVLLYYTRAVDPSMMSAQKIGQQSGYLN